MGVEVAPKFKCSFEENDLVEFETASGWQSSAGGTDSSGTPFVRAFF